MINSYFDECLIFFAGFFLKLFQVASPDLDFNAFVFLTRLLMFQSSIF